MENEKEFIEKFQTTPLTYILVGINILVFLCLEFMGGTTDSELMLRYGAMNPYLIYHFGQWYRLFTCMFLHFGIEHLLNNMLLLFFLGQIFEKAVGTTRFMGIYLGAGLLGSFCSFIYHCLIGQNNIVAGASGAIFGIVGGMIVVILVHKGRYEGITIKRMLFMALITLYFGFVNAGTDNVGHVTGLLGGIIITFLVYGLPMVIKNKRNKKKLEDDVPMNE